MVADSLSLPLGRDHDVQAPGRVDFLPEHGKPDRKRRVLTNDRLAFAGKPDGRPAGRSAGILSVLPLPAQPVRFGGVGSENSSIKHFHLTAVFGAVAFDLRHVEGRV